MGETRLCRTGLGALALVLLTGCGPLLTPMTARLAPEDQRQIDAAWDNMLTPINRVDRQTLLDTTVVYWLYQLGVDRLRLVSEKYLNHGKVVMEINCDRAGPESDEFVVTILDDRGQTLRRERYGRGDVEESAQMAWGCASPFSQPRWERAAPTTEPTTGPIPGATTGPTTLAAPESQPTAEEKRREAERERRLKAVEAATQPARLRGG